MLIRCGAIFRLRLSGPARSDSQRRLRSLITTFPFVQFEANGGVSRETKAGTQLTRTVEIWQRFGVADKMLSKAMRVDEIGDIDRATNMTRSTVKLHLLADETRFPFVINLPQHDMEPVLRDSVAASGCGQNVIQSSPYRFCSAPGSGGSSF